MKFPFRALRKLLQTFSLPRQTLTVMPEPTARPVRPLPPLTPAEIVVLGPRYPHPNTPRLVGHESEWQKLVRVTAERRGLAHSCADYPNDPCGACAQGTGDPFASIKAYRQKDSKAG